MMDDGDDDFNHLYIETERPSILSHTTERETESTNPLIFDDTKKKGGDEVDGDIFRSFNALLAQSVERQTLNLMVAGSSPAEGDGSPLFLTLPLPLPPSVFSSPLLLFSLRRKEKEWGWG